MSGRCGIGETSGNMKSHLPSQVLAVVRFDLILLLETPCSFVGPFVRPFVRHVFYPI